MWMELYLRSEMTSKQRINTASCPRYFCRTCKTQYGKKYTWQKHIYTQKAKDRAKSTKNKQHTCQG